MCDVVKDVHAAMSRDMYAVVPQVIINQKKPETTARSKVVSKPLVKMDPGTPQSPNRMKSQSSHWNTNSDKGSDIPPISTQRARAKRHQRSWGAGCVCKTHRSTNPHATQKKSNQITKSQGLSVRAHLTSPHPPPPHHPLPKQNKTKQNKIDQK